MEHVHAGRSEKGEARLTWQDPSKFSEERFRLPARRYKTTGVVISRSEAGARVKEAQFVSDRRESKTSGDDKREGAMDKAKGRLKEASGALTGDKNKKAEGRSDQRRGTMKEKKGHLKDLFK